MEEVKTAEQKAKDAAHEYVTNHPDSEVRRMYGHHYRSFMDGYKHAETENTRLREALERIRDFKYKGLLDDQEMKIIASNALQSSLTPKI